MARTRMPGKIDERRQRRAVARSLLSLSDPEGKRVTPGSVLILEDDYLIAASLAQIVVDAGHAVVGPASSVEEAKEAMTEMGIDAALLDVNLGGDDRSFELATWLQAMRIPFAFVTSYSPALMPPAFAPVPVLVKPFSREAATKLLDRLLPAASLAG
jgi:two-component SAPR family response regulator